MTVPMTIAGIPVVIEGDGPETIVMLHGWPDSHRIWSRQAAHFSTQYRCVRFTLPGFGEQAAARGHSLASIIDSIREIVDAVSPTQKVILMMHDWGCVFGYQFAMLYPERVHRAIAIDIGDANSAEFRQSLPWTAKGMVASYQLTLAMAWYAGDRIGTLLTRGLARAMQAKAESRHVHAAMNYPYAMRWMRAFGGLDDLKPVALSCPIFYAYGRKKPFMFHSSSWLIALQRQPENVVREFNSGHWVMVDCADAFNAAVSDWLSTTA